MLFGASTACLYPLETEKALEQLGQNGITNVEIFFNAMSELSGTILDTIIETKEQYNINVVSVHPFQCPIEPMGIFSGYKRRTDEFIEIYNRYFEVMNILGAHIFVLHGAAYERSCTFDCYIERYLMLSDIARDYGVTVAQENVINCKSKSLDFLKAVKEKLGKQAAFVLDIKQAYRCGVDPFELLEAIGSNVVHLHVNDNNQDSDCICAGKGNFDFNRFFKQLSEFNYDGAVILELYRNGFGEVRELTDGIEYLKKCAK